MSATIKDVAQELHLDWHAVKELDKQYMRAQLAKAGNTRAQGHRYQKKLLKLSIRFRLFLTTEPLKVWFDVQRHFHNHTSQISRSAR